MIWIPGRPIASDDTRGFKIPQIPMGNIKVRAPSITWKIEKPDFNKLWSNTLESIIKFTEEGARQFGITAAEEIRSHVGNFSKPTMAGAPSQQGSFTPHEKLDLSGDSLYKSIGWRHFKVENEGWKAEAGPGIGRGRKLPMNVKGKSYANFVEKGTGITKKRFVPKMVDLELRDIKDPTNIRTIRNVPKSWVPKMSEDVNPLLEGWFAAKRKRALLKKRSRKAMGRYWATQSLGKGGIFAKKLEGARKQLDKGRPKYEIVSSAGVGPGGPPEGYGLVYHRTRVRQKKPLTYDVWRQFHKQTGGDTEKTFELVNEFMEETLSLYEEYVDVMGGKLRGYGGHHNILRSVGDISYAYFTIDLRMNVLDMTDFNYGLLEGLPGYVTGKAINERGLGVRIPKSRWGGDPGEHPGTPARNYMRNSAKAMKKHLKRWIQEARTGKGKDYGMVKGSKGSLRMFTNWGKDK